MSTDGIGITEQMSGAERSGGPAGRPAGVTAAEQEAGVTAAEIDRIVAGIHHDPHSVLGAHPGPGGVRVRALLPLAATAAVVLADGRRFPMAHLYEGVFAATLPLPTVPDYRLAVAYPGADGKTLPEALVDSPYRYLPT